MTHTDENTIANILSKPTAVGTLGGYYTDQSEKVTKAGPVIRDIPFSTRDGETVIISEAVSRPTDIGFSDRFKKKVSEVERNIASGIWQASGKENESGLAMFGSAGQQQRDILAEIAAKKKAEEERTNEGDTAICNENKDRETNPQFESNSKFLMIGALGIVAVIIFLGGK